ncbi:MAG: 3'-5' exonuclease [Propionibacteriaceae bacterium]
MALDFTAIDFETANSFRGSPCSVGVVKVRDGKTVAEEYLLTKPPVAYAHFDDFNVALHGISAATVAVAPSWGDTWQQLNDFIGDDVLVAHNAAFDMSVIQRACQADGITFSPITYFCTLQLSRRILNLESHSLPYVCQACDVSFQNHHNALADAHAAAAVALAFAQLTKSTNCHELVTSCRTQLRTIPVQN